MRTPSRRTDFYEEIRFQILGVESTEVWSIRGFNGHEPSLAAGPDCWAVAFSVGDTTNGTQDVHVGLLAADGEPPFSTKLSSSGRAGNPSVVWNGRAFAIAWKDQLLGFAECGP